MEASEYELTFFAAHASEPPETYGETISAVNRAERSARARRRCSMARRLVR